MIEKKIHYCWFGNNPLPKKAQICIDSWKRFFPDYEIIEWNEKNFDVNFNKYAKQAYDNKKFAFFTDVARLFIIYNNGGIYFDVDVEVIKKFDDVLLENDAFFGLETNSTVNTGLGFGASKNNWIVKELLEDYNNKDFLNQEGKMDITPCPITNSKIFKREGFKLDGTYEKINGVAVYPIDFFNPLEAATGKLNKTKNTHSIHWFLKSWVPKKQIIISKITKPFHRIFGINCFKWIKKLGGHKK
jgi:hypothetical protein